MQKRSQVEARRSFLLCLFILGLVTTVIVLPYQFSDAASKKGLIVQTESTDPGLPNFDIRTHIKDRAVQDYFMSARNAIGRNAVAVADIRDGFVRGEEALKARLPQVKFEYNEDIRIPEVITPDVWKLKVEFLSSPSSAKRSEILRNFVKQNDQLVGVSNDQADQLLVTADYTNPDGNLSFAGLEQRINGLPVFRGEVKAGFNKDGQIIRVINNLAPGLDYGSLSTDFGDPVAAVKAASGHINYNLKATDLIINAAASNDDKATFGDGDWATTAEKMYFPTEPGVAIPSWRVLIWEPVNAYYVIVDAHTGTLLWRKNITNDQSQSATYQVYTNTNAMINVADNPAPLTPGPINPTLGTQGTIISRNNVTLVGNEAPYTFNNSGWITDGTNVTDGNNLQAGIDRDGVNGVDATQSGAPNRVFDSTWNPPPGSPAPGDDPLTAQAQRGAVIQMFYVMNRYHDELYRLGFTEQARNFQASNFGRGGVENDRVSAEGQDSSGTNNANFGSPADGGRGRMQMYLWTGPTPDYDGTTDAEIIIHEVTHGTSNRLHGNSSGLSTNMSAGMGEGWGDFYAHSMLSEPTDPINGIYTEGGYATFLGTTGYTANYYYGIRRYPKAVMAFTGGANNKPHNAFTFSYVNSDCNTRMNTTNFAFARGPFGVSTCDQVHNLGEIWSSTLWEIRAKFVTRLGWAVGNRRMLQFVTDGMKLAPLGPTFLQERDAIIAAAQASGTPQQVGPDVADLWAGFALRGMGFSASVQSAGTGANNTAVTESFDLPNLLQTPTLTVSDSTGDNDGSPEPGETVMLNISLTNSTGLDATGTTLQIVGGGSADYGTITNAQTVAKNISYNIPANTPCGSALTLTLNVNSSLGATSFTRQILIGSAVTTATENFDAVTAPTFPANWTATSVQSGLVFVNSPLNPDTGANSAFAADPTTIGGGSDLTSPSFPITTSAATVSFRNRYDSESGWDGGVLEISIAGGAFQDIITAGGRFLQNGYNGTLGQGTNNPLANRNAWTGNSNGFVTTVAQLPASAAGQNVQLRFRFGGDDNTAGQGPNPGWYVDTLRVNGTAACSFVATARTPFDFDGDGKTDISIFRPNAAAEWWYSKSSNNQVVAGAFGTSTDIPTPGDFTGDGKTDIAFFRPSTGQWFILRSEDNSFLAFPFGQNGDIPMPADYDNDGKTDPAVFRAGTWFISRTGGGGVLISAFGVPGDQPVAADYDGDGKADIAIVRTNGVNKEWWIQRSSAGLFATVFGAPTDKAAPGDFTGDGKADVAFWRPSTGQWFILRSEDLTFLAFPFGQTGDQPVPGDYDGDHKIDAAVFRPSASTWFVNRSNGAGTLIQSFGNSTDVAAPGAYVR